MGRKLDIESRSVVASFLDPYANASNRNSKINNHGINEQQAENLTER